MLACVTPPGSARQRRARASARARGLGVGSLAVDALVQRRGGATTVAEDRGQLVRFREFDGGPPGDPVESPEPAVLSAAPLEPLPVPVSSVPPVESPAVPAAVVLEPVVADTAGSAWHAASTASRPASVAGVSLTTRWRMERCSHMTRHPSCAASAHRSSAVRDLPPRLFWSAGSPSASDEILPLSSYAPTRPTPQSARRAAPRSSD